EYGIEAVYRGAPAKLGRGGVTEIVELPLTGEELADLREAADAVRSKQADVAKLVGSAAGPPGAGRRPVRGRAADALVPHRRPVLGRRVPDLPHPHGGLAPPRPRPASPRPRPYAGPPGRGGRRPPPPPPRPRHRRRRPAGGAPPPPRRRLPHRPGDAPHPRPLPRPRPRPRLAGVRLEMSEAPAPPRAVWVSGPIRRVGGGCRAPGTSSRGRWRPGRRG